MAITISEVRVKLRHELRQSWGVMKPPITKVVSNIGYTPMVLSFLKKTAPWHK
jgi:hypothetical protein